jgi:hypothetical protein
MSDELLGRYRDMAAFGGNFHGLSILQHVEQIGKLLRQHQCESVLDWGCGRADAYGSPHKIHGAWGIKRKDVHLYDPAFKSYAEKPTRKADAVICSDVLEHVPEDEVADFILDLFDHAKKVVWASVCCRPARKCFPNTEINLHVTVKPFEWWQDKFENLSSTVPFVLVETT